MARAGGNGLCSDSDSDTDDEGDRRRRKRWDGYGWGNEWDYFFGKGGKDGRPRDETPSTPDFSDPPGSGARPKTGSNPLLPQPGLRGTGGDPSHSFGHIGGRDVDLLTLQQNIKTLRENAQRRRGASGEQIVLQVQVVDLMKVS